MKKYIAILLAGALLAVSCREKEPEFVKSDKGPEQTVTCDAAALMGSTFHFSVHLKDVVALSTLKVELLFDETVVASKTLRTREEGDYEDVLEIPFYKNVPDGTATARFTSQNVQFGVTTEDKDVNVSRPDFAYLTLKAADGSEYKMDKKEKYVYAVTGNFPAAIDATIETAPFGTDERTLTFGYDATGVTLDGAKQIPFSNGVAGNYEISFNTKTWEAAPFIKLEVNGTEAVMAEKDKYTAVLNLAKGDAIEITGYEPGFDDFTFDPDYIGEDKKFAAVDGLYRVSILMADKWVLVERMASQTDLATLGSDGHGAVWIIGDKCFGKPAIFPYGWNTDFAVCMAEVESQVFQATLVGGYQIKTDDVNIKFFHQKGWGGEFKGEHYVDVDSEFLYVNEADGNIHLLDGVKLELGGIYVLTLDLTGGNEAAKFSCVKAGQQEVEIPAMTINGVEFEGGPTEFTATLQLTQGSTVILSNVDGLASYWIDPDYCSATGQFLAVSGNYKVILDISGKTIMARRVTDTGGAANLSQGGLYIQGWGVAAYQMTGQVGWPGTGGYAMAQVAPGKFQMTGQAVAETDPAIGGRFRYDYISAKYFFQDGWGGEASKGVTISGSAADKLTQGSDGNFGLASNLEDGATYRLTVDFSGCTLDGASISSGVETVQFDKL